MENPKIPVELTIRVKNEDQTLNMKHLIYEEISLSWEDELLRTLVNEAIDAFKGTPDDVIVKTKMVWTNGSF